MSIAIRDVTDLQTKMSVKLTNLIDIANANRTNTSESYVKCAVCLAADINSVFLPCAHMVACFDCAMEWRRSSKTCIMCRKNIRRVMRTFSG